MKALTPVKAIRAKCLDCSNGQYVEVRLCPLTACPLYPYRLGHRPKTMPVSEHNLDEAGDPDTSPDDE